MVRLLCVSLLSLLSLYALASAPPSPPSFSLGRRVPWNTSRVVGSPDPPPPYRTRRVFEKLTFRQPVYLISHPVHDLLFVVEQSGRVVHFPPSGTQTPTEFLKVPDADTYSMTFHPKYATNRLVYVFANGPNSKPKRTNQILSYKVAGDPPRCDPASKKLIIEWESNGHNGGDLAFGRDGMLYVTSGDGTSDSDENNTGQDLRDLTSGMIRIDVDRPAKGKHYAVPADNPFLKTPAARPELWAFGFRNPWRMTFHPVSGELLVGDVGQDAWEMIRLVTRGSNHGWSVTEGSRPFQPLRPKGPGEVVLPLIEHPHSESRSITGGVFYQGKKLPGLRDVYVYGDYATGKIWGLKLKEGKLAWKGEIANTRLQMVGFGLDRDGELYVVDYAGQIHTFEPSPPVKNRDAFPRRLSETGLFTSVKGHRLHPALIPYSVNAPLWSDGTHKERAMAVPGLETAGFTEDGPWQFPEKTVLVKTFAIDGEDGSRRRIETRLLTLQEGEWAGYSYVWNRDQTDADLVPAGGMNSSYRVRDKGKLDWRYPSRVECMVCHTRAAQYVLGVSTLQLNREHDYGSERLNQLEALSRLGLFRLPRQQHWQAAEERVRLLGKLARAALPLGALSPLQKCCLQPAGKAIVAAAERKSQAAAAKVAKRGGTANQLPRLPGEYPRLVDPEDTKADLTLRVRSYLQGNCAHCHVWAGGGNSAIDLAWKTPLDKTKLINEKPLHDRFEIKDARLVAPGAPERSILYQRLSRRGKGQMPPLGTACTDERAAGMVREWIKRLK